jgi:GrpB-like predicted nucleotidyltransferase (UPF0157 family)
MLGLKNGIIKLVDFSPTWALEFKKEKAILQKKIGQYIKSIEHIGSTSIKNIKAKPIIDLMIGLKDFNDITKCSKILESSGYINKGEYGIPNRIFFTKSKHDITTHHLHVVQYGSDFWNKHIRFRDLLNNNDDLKTKYEKLKERLKEKHKDNRDLYTSGKSDFINEVLKNH